MDWMLFNDWSALARTLVVGVLAYVVLVAMLRASGKRTLSKMNAFDLIVTVALGSTLATVLVSKDVSLAQGALALAVLIALQFAITWTSVRWRAVRHAVTGEPDMLVCNGALERSTMKRCRITEEEVRAALRGAGLARIEDAARVVLETDGSISVVPRAPFVTAKLPGTRPCRARRAR